MQGPGHSGAGGSRGGGVADQKGGIDAEGRGHGDAIRFSEGLVTGVALIDLQHRRFFELAASLAEGKDPMRVMRSLALLSDHVRSHFREEERLMAACAYARLDDHRRLHEEIRDTLADLLTRARTMTLDGIADEVTDLIRDRLCAHILSADLDYAPHVAAAQFCQP